MILYVMLYTIAAGLPLLLGAFGIAALLRHYGKPERGIWLGALVLTFVLPIASLIDLGGSAPAAVTGLIGLPEVVTVPIPDASLDIGSVLVALWISASLVMAVRWVVATLRLDRRSRSWRPDMLDGVSVLITEDVGPAVSGVLRPRVLVPPWLADLPAHERVLVLMHEQEHVRARDPIVVAFARGTRILAPWNPVIWVLTAMMVRAIELDCDRRVLKRSSDVAAYGHTLLKMSVRRPGRLVAASAFAESEAPLRGRILSMTTPSRTISVAAIAAATILGVVLLVGSLGIPVPVVNIEVRMGLQADQAPTFTAVAAAPAPAIEPPRPVVISELVLYRGPDGEPTGYRLEPTQASPPPSVQPRFTPMSVRPQLINVEVVQQALVREYATVLREADISAPR